MRWETSDPSRFNDFVLGRQILRTEGQDSCRLRMQPRHMNTNTANNVHGGVILSLADVAMFAAVYVLRGIDAGKSVTVDLATQFIGAASPAKPLDAIAELLRETRRLAFLRGLIVQDDACVASFSGTIRKPSTSA